MNARKHLTERQLSSKPRQATIFTVTIVIMDELAHSANDKQAKCYVESTHEVDGAICTADTNAAKIHISNFYACVCTFRRSAADVLEIVDHYDVLS